MPKTTITELQNPLTESMVRLEPPFTTEEDGLTEQLYDAFNAFCAVAATFDADPAVVNPDLLLLGEHPLPDLNQGFLDLVHTWGAGKILTALQDYYATLNLLLDAPRPRHPESQSYVGIAKEFTYGTPVAASTFFPMAGPATSTYTFTGKLDGEWTSFPTGWIKPPEVTE